MEGFKMSAIYQLLFGWLPAEIAAVFLGLFSVVIVFLVFRIVKIVLDSLPFL